MPEKLVYRVRKDFLGVGLAISAMALLVACYPGYHVLTGTPLLVGGRGQATHAAILTR